MPGYDVITGFVAFGKFLRQCFSVFAVGGTVWAGIMAASKFMFHPMKIRPENIRILACHPCRMRARGSGKTDFHAVFCHGLYDFV